MKKIFKIVLVLLCILSTKNTSAAKYNMKELIPESIKNTIRGDIF